MVFHSNSLLPCSSLRLGSLCQQHCGSDCKVWDFSALGFLPSHCPLWHSKLRGTTCTAFTDPHFALLPFIIFYLLSSLRLWLRGSFAVSWSQPLESHHVPLCSPQWQQMDLAGNVRRWKSTPPALQPPSVCLCLLPHQTMKISFTIISLQFSVPPG